MTQKYVKPLSSAGRTKETEPEQVNFIYDKANYTLLAASAIVVALGFVLMAGTTDIYNTTKIVVAPIVVLAGFGLGFYALLKKPTDKV